jgi:hypothetical protein
MLPCKIGLLKDLWSLTIVMLVSCDAKRSPLWVARSYAWKCWYAPRSSSVRDRQRTEHGDRPEEYKPDQVA